MIIINAKIETMETDAIERGYLIITDQKITAIGSGDPPCDADGERLDAAGKTVYPGFVDAHCHIGMWEDGLGFEGDDGNEDTDPITPQIRAIDAVNPFDHCFEEALQGGITTVLTGPGSANPIAGQWCAMKTYGRRIDDMILDSNIGMKFALGENPKSIYHGKNQMPITRMAIASLIRESLFKAQKYEEDLEKAQNDEDCDDPDYDMECEALIPVLKGEKKAFFHAHRADDICTAIRISKEFSLDYVLIHATEGYLIADILQQEHAKVITGPIISDRSKPELSRQTPKNPGLLYKDGVRSAVCTDHPVIPIQYLPLSAGICVKEGLPYREALKAITIYPAQICGIADRVGSIKVGKDADLVLYSQDPLSSYASPEMVILNGKIVYTK